MRLCAQNTPTCCDIFGCKYLSCHVPARDEKMRDPPKFIRPDTDHPPKREYNRHDVCRDELNLTSISVAKLSKDNHSWQSCHLLRVYLPVPLYVPIYGYANDRRACLHHTEVCIILESELEPHILANSHQGRRCALALAEAPNMSTSLCYVEKEWIALRREGRMRTRT